jgi:hypothetical protein
VNDERVSFVFVLERAVPVGATRGDANRRKRRKPGREFEPRRQPISRCFDVQNRSFRLANRHHIGERTTRAMSWIWEKSSTWRWIVRGTRGNPLAMGVFTATTMFAVPIGLGTLVMNGTNPEMDAAKIEKLRRDAGLDTKIMVRFPGGPSGRRPPAFEVIEPSVSPA